MSGLPLLEFELEDVDGNVFLLGPRQRHALEISGLGMPPVQHWTTREPYSHGEVHWGYAFKPRFVDIILATQGCGRDGMYEGRRDNIEMLNPMNGPHKLRLKVPRANLVYEVHKGWYVDGYELTSTEQSQNSDGTWNQVGSPRFKFMDPMWKWVNSPLDVGETRDADGRTCISDNTFTLTPALVLPFTGPYLLGTTTALNTLNCTIDGTWEVKPLITITGPAYDWTLSNAANGDFLSWDGYNIAAGESIAIDIPAKTVTSTVVGDVSTYLSGDTASFSLDPGLNVLTFFASGGVVHLTTQLDVCWFVELLGT
jgi:hypothetical protein